MSAVPDGTIPGATLPPSGSKRFVVLDYLRGIAVLLVLIRHTDALPPGTPEWVKTIWTPFFNIGWAGVDLFFVMSGFLVSGLLFEEYKKNGRVYARRFLIRRGLKIYPAFYIVMLVFFAIVMSRNGVLPWDKLIPELLFYQNYVPGVWRHTWTLAVEEHFYIVLAIMMTLLARRKTPGADNPFRLVPLIFIAVAVLCLTLRILHFIDLPEQRRVLQTWTHFRIDSLGFGVCLSYLFHFRKEAFMRFFQRWKIPLILFAAAGIAPFCNLEFTRVSEDLSFILTVGFTILYLAFGLLLGVAVTTRLEGKQSLPGRALQIIGVYSYSIYLWHMAVKSLLPFWHTKIFKAEPTPSLELAYYLGGSIVLGILLSLLIEYPVLKWRNRRFPAIPKLPVT